MRTKTQKQGIKKRKTSISIEGFLYILPAMIILIVFTFYPFLKTFILSFFRVTSSLEVKEFVGLSNYQSIMNNPNFIQSIKNSGIFAAIVTPAVMIIGFLLALLANKKRAASPVYELMYAITMAVSSSVAAMIFQLMYSPSIGILNHWIGKRINWLNDPKVALVALMIIWIWINVGYNFIFMLSSVRGIDKGLIEASSIDGANFWKRSFYIAISIRNTTCWKSNDVSLNFNIDGRRPKRFDRDNDIIYD